MERLNLKKLIETITELPDENCQLIIIEEDLSEGFYIKKEIKERLYDLLDRSIGYCFVKDVKEYFFWKYDAINQDFVFVKKQGIHKVFPNSKLQNVFNFVFL